jgi:TatA/E family protein of Tat protein translocase
MIALLAFGMPAAPEWIFIGILALILFGPKKIPEIARGLGKALGELQRAKEDFHREITGVPPLPKIETPPGRRSAYSGENHEPEVAPSGTHEVTDCKPSGEASDKIS